MGAENIALRRALLRALLGVGVIVAIVAVILTVRDGVFLPRAFLIVLLTLAGNNSLLDLQSRHTDTQAVVTLVAYARLLIIAIVTAAAMDYVLRTRLPMIYARKGKTMEDHVIVVGLGQLGYRVLKELEDLGFDTLVIESSQDAEFIDYARSRKIPVIFEDIRKQDNGNKVLEAAGLEAARALVACTSDDLTNLDVAISAREMRRDLRIVVKLFDQRLAEKIARAFDIQVSFSMAALAAPSFATAAVDRSVAGSFKVEGETYVHCRFLVPSSSTLSGMTIHNIREDYGVNLVALSCEGETTFAPSGSTVIPDRALVHLVGAFDRVQRLKDNTGISKAVTWLRSADVGAEDQG